MAELDKFLKLQMVPYKLVRADNGDAWVEVIILPLLHSCILQHLVDVAMLALIARGFCLA